MNPVTLPKNASAWLKEAFESALLHDPRQTLFDAKTLVALLRKRRLQQSTQTPPKIFPETGGVQWMQVGDVHVFNSNTPRLLINQLGRSQGWNISINKCRKTGSLRAMAMTRV